MKRTVLAILAAASFGPIAASAAPPISLDAPGVPDRIAAENPEHYQRLVGILRISQEMPCDREQLERFAVHYDAREARCSTMLMTSLPSKRRLSFRLDDQMYTATVEMNEYARVVKVPAPKAPKAETPE